MTTYSLAHFCLAENVVTTPISIAVGTDVAMSWTSLLYQLALGRIDDLHQHKGPRVITHIKKCF